MNEGGGGSHRAGCPTRQPATTFNHGRTNMATGHTKMAGVTHEAEGRGQRAGRDLGRACLTPFDGGTIGCRDVRQHPYHHYH